MMQYHRPNPDHDDAGRTGRKPQLRTMTRGTLLDMRAALMEIPSGHPAWEVFGLPALADVDDVLYEFEVLKGALNRGEPLP